MLVPHPLGGIGEEDVMGKVDRAALLVARALAKDASTHGGEARDASS